MLFVIQRKLLINPLGEPRFLSLRKNMNLRIFLIVFFLTLLAVPVLAQTESKYGGQLVMASASDPKSFNAIVAQETTTSMITSHIFDGLTEINAATLEIEPALAERWTVSPDGEVCTFHLRKDVVWNDGHPFTADDVVFTFNDLIYNENIPAPARDIFMIEGKKFEVVKIDDYTVRFTLPVKFAPFLQGMAGQEILPKHKLAKVVDEGRFNFFWGIDTPPEEIVGTGPFMLAKYNPGERIVLKSNPRYWKKSAEGETLPYLSKIIYLIVMNTDTAIMKFIDGELDYISLRGMDFPVLKPLEKKKDFTIYDTGPDFGTNFITFNQNSDINPSTQKPFVDPLKLKWFTNLKFRQAVAHSIDKKKIIEILMNELGYPQHAAMSPSAKTFYNPHVLQYDYDLAKAARILEEGGFRNDSGVLKDNDGNPVSFNLITNGGSTERVQIASIIRHDLQKLGMRINFVGMEFNTLVSKVSSTHDWEGLVLGLTGGIEPHFGKNVWSSNGLLHMWHPKQKSPATPWEKRLDEIFNTGVQELDEQKRKVLYDEFQLIVSRELPVVYTVLASNLLAVRNKFENLKPTTFGGAFHNLEEIYVKEEYRGRK